MEYILRTYGLSKKYKKHFAVNKADMNIEKGDIYGFVGENGSGKTTIIRLITGLIFPTDGHFELFGVSNNSVDIVKARKKLGAIVETPSIYLNMSAYDNLKMQATLLGLKDESSIQKVLSEVGLDYLVSDKRKAGNFSLGMRQRLGIAMALLGNPEFLILDEPMNGLDPTGIVEIRELILKLNRDKGITFLISSHILTELSLVATKYGIISKGKIIKEITAKELHNECQPTIILQADDPAELDRVLSDIIPKENKSVLSGCIKISGSFKLNAILSKVLAAGINLTSVNCSETNIEDYYLSLTGGKGND